MKPKHPMQPVVWDGKGVIRFKENPIIRDLLEEGNLDLNEIAIRAAHQKYSEDDQMQLAQLIGYSVSGYSNLSYVSDENYEEADARAEQLRRNK